MTNTQEGIRIHIVPTRTRALLRKQFHFFPDGTICLSVHGHTTFEYAKAHLSKFDGDEERALFHAMEKENFPEFNAFIQELYAKDREGFIEKVPVIVGPYEDKNKIYDPEQHHKFKLEYPTPNFEAEINPSLDAWLNSVSMIKADRLESAIAIWEHTSNMDFDLSSHGYHLIRVTELDKEMSVLNVWEARSPQTHDFELVLVSSTTAQV